MTWTSSSRGLSRARRGRSRPRLRTRTRTKQLRGKDVEIDVTLKDLKYLQLAESNPEFLSDLGFENEAELRDALREQMVERITFDVQQALREQVSKHLLDSIQFDLPAKLSTKQADRVVQRRAMELMHARHVAGPDRGATSSACGRARTRRRLAS